LVTNALRGKKKNCRGNPPLLHPDGGQTGEIADCSAPGVTGRSPPVPPVRKTSPAELTRIAFGNVLLLAKYVE
jgi:hypothetical protein